MCAKNYLTLIFILTVFMFPPVCMAQTKTDRFPVIVGVDQCGYIDQKGNLAIKAEFLSTYAFSEGLGRVITNKIFGFIPTFGFYKKYGYVDQKGKFVIKPKYEIASDFSEGLAAVVIGKKWGFIDTAGNIAIKPKFEEQPSNFHEGLAAIEINDKFGFIDKNGNIVIRPQYKGVEHFSEGLALALNNESKFGYIDKTGAIIIPFQFDKAESFSQGFANVKYETIQESIAKKLKAIGISGENWFYINKKGEVAFKKEFDMTYPFSEDFAAVEYNFKPGYINLKGEIVFTIENVVHGPFSEGLAPIIPISDNFDNFTGFINRKGRTVIQPHFLIAKNFKNGLALVQKRDHKWAYIDKNANVVWETP